MTTAISIINLKGGVGKTTLSVALAEMWADQGQRVLVIDLDPQTNSTVALIGEERWLERHKAGKTIFGILDTFLKSDTPQVDIDSFIVKRVSNVKSGRGIEGLDLLPSSLKLLDIQDQLVNINVKDHRVKADEVLKSVLAPIASKYDKIIVDCPPNVGLITKNGLFISDYYLIPVIPDYLSTFGLPMVSSRIAQYGESIKRQILPIGIVVSKFRQQSTVHRQVAVDLRTNQYGIARQPIPVLEPCIPEANDVAQAMAWEDLAGNKLNHTTVKTKYGGKESWSALARLAEDVNRRISSPVNP
jgi:chromosome partitioning protein